MQLWKKDETPSPSPEQEEIESTFDIILCDCDAEFYSDEAYKASLIFFLSLQNYYK
jgi:hypothetical protein